MVDWEAIFKKTDAFWNKEHGKKPAEPVQAEPEGVAELPEDINDPEAETKQNSLEKILYDIEKHAGRQSIAIMHTLGGLPLAQPKKYNHIAKTLSAILGEEMRVRAHGITEDLAAYTLHDATLERYGINGRELENYQFATSKIAPNICLTVGFWKTRNTKKMDSVLEAYKKELIEQFS